MKFALNDEQQALSDATKDYFTSKVTSDLIRTAMVSDAGYNKDLFRSLCNELGLASLVIPEEYGGFGAGDVELAVALEHHGYVLAPTPLRTHATSAFALLECATHEAKQKYLPLIASGEALCYTDYFSESTNSVEITNVANGQAVRIPFGLDTKYLFLYKHGSLHVIDLESAGIERKSIPSIDQTLPLSNLIFNSVPVELVSDSDITEQFKRAQSRAVVAAANEMVGSTQAVLDMSVAYAKDRTQFGRPIGSFQAIKHKCADMLLETESARSVAMYAAWLSSQEVAFTSEDLEDDLGHISSMAKYYTSKTFSHVTGENIQIHGGIGFTFEHDAHLYFKRAAFMAVHLGTVDEHSQNLAKEMLDRV